MEATSPTVNARYATQTAGTCRYMMRCTLPCVTSRGATPKPMMSPVARPMAASQPSSVLIFLSAFQDDVEGQEADRQVHDVCRDQELEPVRDRGQRLSQQQRLGGLHR